MARSVRTALPDDEYLLLIGQLSYMVTSLEGLLLFDLPRLAPYLPNQPPLDDIVGQTTAQIGDRLISLSKHATDDSVRDYLHVGGTYLKDIAKVRNQVLHARPATIDNQQMLHRWNPAKGDILDISKPWLQKQIDRIDEMMIHLYWIRP